MPGWMCRLAAGLAGWRAERLIRRSRALLLRADVLARRAQALKTARRHLLGEHPGPQCGPAVPGASPRHP